MKRRLLAIIASLFVCAGAVWLIWRNELSSEGFFVGADDYLQFYCAARLFAERVTPYGRAALFPVMHDVGYLGRYDWLEYFNPPWLLPFISPFALLPFSASVLAWMVMSFVSVGVAGILIWRCHNPRGELPLSAMASSFLFLPHLECIGWGQLGMVLALVYAGTIWALLNGRDRLAGVLLAVATVKPQSALLFSVGVGWWAMRNGRREFIYAGVLTLALLALLCEVVVPGIYSTWRLSPESQHFLLNFRGATIAGALRAMTFETVGSRGDLLLIIVPIICAALALVLAERFKRASVLELAPPLICLSLLGAPYGWHHDQSIAMIIQVGAVAASFASAGSRRAKQVLSLFLAYNLCWLVVSRLFEFGQHQFMLFPVGLLVLALFTRNGTAKSSSLTACLHV